MINYFAYGVFGVYVVLAFVSVYLAFYWRRGFGKVFFLMGLGLVMLFFLVSFRPLFLVMVEGSVETRVELVDQSGVRFVNSTIVPRYVPTPYGDLVFMACSMCVLLVFLLSMYSWFDFAVHRVL